jgi:hypothetical protein
MDAPVRSLGTADFDGNVTVALAGTMVDQPTIEPELVGAVRLKPVHLEAKRVEANIGLPQVALGEFWIEVAVLVLAGIRRQVVQPGLKVLSNVQSFGKRPGVVEFIGTINF